MDDGLPSNQIRKVFKAKDGFMWFLTEGGLCRYDGYKIITYQNNPRNPNSLSYNELFCYLEDEDGTLWIGSKSGLNRFDPKTGIFKRYFHDPKNPNSLSNNFITCMLKDRKGRYWIGTEKGINLFDPVRDFFRSFTHDPDNPTSLGITHVNRLVEDASGTIWIGPTNNMWIERFNPDTNSVQRFKQVRSANSQYADVISMITDSSGILWFGSWAQGLFRLNPSDGTFRNYLRNPNDSNSITSDIVQCITPDGKGGYWIGTRDGGLCRFDPQTERFHSVKLVWKTDPNMVVDTVMDIYEDNTGILWIGTMDDGVCRYDSNREQFRYIKNNPKDPKSLRENRVYALYTSRDGTIWIGTNGGGLNQYNPQTGNIMAHYVHDPSDPASLPCNTVISLYESPAGTLYVGCWQTEKGAFCRFIPETKTFRRYPHEPNRADGLQCIVARFLLGDHTGKIWIGTDGNGVNIFDPVTETFEHYSPNTPIVGGAMDRDVRCFYEDHNRTMWIGTESAGLLFFDRARNQFVKFLDPSPNPNLLPTSNIQTIYEDRENTLWIGTVTSLVRLNADRTLTTAFSTNDGLADNAAKGILEDENGFLWISMDNGKLSRFNPATGEVRNFDRSDGLQGSTFIANCKTRGLNGDFYFGGLNGVNCVWPIQITQNMHVPPIALTSFEVMAKPHPIEPYLSTGKAVELDYRHNFLSFEFAALNFTHTYKNQYAYRLSPLESDWNHSGNRRYAQYSALEPGRYVFQAKGTNNDGVWNEEGVSFAFYIQPPIWRTSWFKTIAGGSIAVILLWGYLYRIRFLQKQKKILELEVEKRTRELYEANRTLDLLSKQDGLTKVANRRYFDEHIELEWRRALRNQTYISLIFGDVDFFKRYNDLYGHQAGDECLQMVADILREQVMRPGDLVARYGGEEFVVVLTDADPKDAEQFANLLRMRIEAVAMPHQQSDAASVVTISMGVATMIPHPEKTFQDLIQAADQALYHAKTHGRNQVHAKHLT